ncbi:MAG TPA: cytochrome c peroxidase, partial [Saprospiraceae bacterium]|nr:cytochrome c peroxidase [Saprospiraceae bacterium]
SMPLGNVASVSAHYNPLQEVVPPFLWDQRATTISDLSRMAFTSPNEMGMTMPGVVERVREGEYYPLLFKNTYGETEVTEARIMECLTEFVGAIGGGNSPLDRALEKTRASLDMANTVSADTLRNAVYYGTADTVITITTVFRGMDGLGEQENRGRTLFVTHCTKCHSPVRPFQEVIAACNGLEMNYKDLGLAAVTKRPEDVGVFKSPSLRNIALTAPYMHDGRFGTLQQVIDFYSDDIQPHPNLHPLLRNANGSPGLKLTLAQKTQLLAFLRTLTDADITQDPKFSDPFKR